jgi:hypothetical protein
MNIKANEAKKNSEKKICVLHIKVPFHPRFSLNISPVYGMVQSWKSLYVIFPARGIGRTCIFLGLQG